MKNLILVAILILCASVAFSQTVQRIDQAKNFRTGTGMTAMAYTSTKIDTTQAIDPRGFSNVSLLIWVHDSASVQVKFQPSYTGVLFGEPVFIDSLSSDIDSSSATVVGNYFSASLPAAALSYPRVRFVLDFDPFRAGVTSPRFDAKIIRTP